MSSGAAWYQTPLEDYTSDNWADAKKHLNANAYNRLRRIARKAGVVGDGNGPFAINMSSPGETATWARAQNKARQEEFNKRLQGWSRDVISQLKASISALIKRDRNLSKSLKVAYQYKYGELKSIGFSFAREGVYVHHGAGRGYGGNGSRTKWYDRYGNERKVSADSLGKMGSGNRRPVDWFNSVIERNLDALADIVAEYDPTIDLDTASIFID